MLVYGCGLAARAVPLNFRAVKLVCVCATVCLKYVHMYCRGQHMFYKMFFTTGSCKYVQVQTMHLDPN